MATVYSLICFGGRLGKTVTFTDVGDVVNLTRHGLRDGTGVVFSTTGALPTGITAGTTYYSKQGADSGKFTIWTDATLTTQVTFTDAGSGTNTVKGSYRNSLTTDQLLRYGAAGSERIYDGLGSCYTAQSASASYFDEEAWEIGEDFIDDRNNSGMGINMPSPVLRIYPINGAGHNGVYGTGYTLLSATTSISNPVITLSSQIELSGITAQITGLGGSGVQVAHPRSVVDSCIVIGGGTSGGNSYGIKAGGVYCQYTNNLVKGFKRGFELYQNSSRQVIAHNIATGNDTGFYPMTTSSYFGFYYNNIGIGNVTANWGAQPAGITGAGSNCGLSGDTTWNTSPNSAITIATTDFINYAGNDFAPASSSSPQVDSAVEYYQIIATDIVGNERPNYNNGGAEGYDCGCYEFDNGYGPHPASHELTLTNVVVGSRVFIRDQGDTTTHHDAIAAASPVIVTITVYGDSRDNWRIRVRKASGSPTYIPYETLMTATAGSSSIYVSQIPDE